MTRPASVTRPLPSVRPDCDNLLKACLDGLNGAAFRDDAQVTSIVAQKRYCAEGQKEGLQITLEDDPAALSVGLVAGERAVLVRTTSYRKGVGHG